MKIPLLAVPHAGLRHSPLSLPEHGQSSAPSPTSCFVSLNQAYQSASIKKFSTRPKNIFECEKQLENFYRGEMKKNPKRGKSYLDLGNYYLTRKNYLTATVYLESGHQVDPSNGRILEQLGKAYYGLKNFSKARERYGNALLIHSRNPNLLRLHTEASLAYLQENSEKLNADQIEQIHHEIAADHALRLALKVKNEKKKLKEIKSQLNQLRSTSKEQSSQILAIVMQTALLYLQLSEIKFPDPRDTALVQKEIKPLALELFDTLSQKAKISPHLEIKNLGKLYSAYLPYLQGNDPLAKQRLSEIIHIPEAQTFLKLLENKSLRAKNLAALSIWENYIREGKAIETDKAKSLFFRGIADPIEELRGNRPIEERIKFRWNLERELLQKVKSLLLDGTATSIQEALAILSRDESKSIRELSASLLLSSHSTHHASGNILPNLISFVGKESSESRSTENLLQSVIELERHYGPLATAIGTLALIKNTASQTDFQAKADRWLHKIKSGKDFADLLKDEALTMTPMDLVTNLLIFKGAWKASNLAKKGMMMLLKNKFGLTHILWVILARSIAVWSEVGTIWGLSLLRDAFKFDPAKVFTTEKMLQRFVVLSLTVRGIKTMGAIGVAISPGLAQLFNLISKDGTKLTTGGMFMSWSILHTSAFLGLVGVDIGLQKLGTIPPPGIIGVDWVLRSANRFFKPLPGGAKESIAKNLAFYLQYAFAARRFTKFFGPQSHASQIKTFQEVLRLEAEASVEKHIKKSGFTVTARDKSGHPDFGKVANGHQTGSAQSPSVIPWVKDFYHQAIQFQLTRPGFSSGKMLKVIRTQGIDAAQTYLKQFSMKLEAGKNGELFIRDLTLHEEIGISLGEPVPPPPAISVKRKPKRKSNQRSAIAP